ncbi:MAG: hypothetical protein JSU70_08950 [Phycisphaerales bacterium]|nr:MAG: hypothetical protein JSU70_08950 [Phycisphaerales bacterium]
MRQIRVVSLPLATAFLLTSSLPVLAHTDVTPQQAKDMIDTNDQLIVVDVRELFEYCDSVGHIPGALNYPWSSGVLQVRHEELPREAPILLVCRSGNRSNQAATFLDSRGYSRIFDMLGGMRAWLWETTLCIDSDEDAVNDDLDNCPSDYNPSQADSDADGIGNACDVDCPSLDASDRVNLLDFAAIADAWQQSGITLAGDLNGDGDITVTDLAIFASYWLSTCSEEQI